MGTNRKMTLATMSAEDRKVLEDFMDLVDQCIFAVVRETVNRPADTIDSMEELCARVMQKLLAQEKLDPDLRKRKEFLSMAIESQAKFLADIWKCPDCGATFVREAKIQ
jgi:hypothetical protein